jgi:hypothetical protein
MSDLPILIKTAAVKDVYKNIEEEDETGTVTGVKMRASPEFIPRFNELVHSLLIDCINNARSEGRIKLIADDVPSLSGAPVEPVAE